MATAYSTILTDLDASPRVIQDAANLKGKLRIAAATVEAGTGDIDLDDIILMVEVPSNAIVHSLVLLNDDLDSNATPLLTSHLGVYAGDKIIDTDASTTVYQKDAVIDADCYATAVTALQDSNNQGSEFAFEVKDIANINKAVWQDCGLTSDPQTPLRIGLTISATAGTAAAGSISMRCMYAVA